MSAVMQPQSVPSRISVVLVEKAEVRSAECLVSGPVDKAVRLLSGVPCLSSGTGCMAGVMMPGAVGKLSPSDFESVGHAGPYGTLSPSDSESVGPVGPYGTLSPSDFDSVGPVGPDGTLSTSDLAGIPIPAAPVGIPCPVGPVGGAYSSEWDGPVMNVDVVDLDVVDMDVTENNCPVAPDVNASCAVVAMIGLDTVQRREEAPMNWDVECAEWDIRNEFETINGMPVYYGGNLCDSDCSEWDDPWGPCVCGGGGSL